MAGTRDVSRQSLLQGIDSDGHLCGVSGEATGLKGRLDQSPLADPLLAFGNQHAVAVPLSEHPQRARIADDSFRMSHQHFPHIVGMKEEIQSNRPDAAVNTVAVVAVQILVCLNQSVLEPSCETHAKSPVRWSGWKSGRHRHLIPGKVTAYHTSAAVSRFATHWKRRPGTGYHTFATPAHST